MPLIAWEIQTPAPPVISHVAVAAIVASSGQGAVVSVAESGSGTKASVASSGQGVSMEDIVGV